MGLKRGVALDLDGVLIDGLPFHIEAWKHAFRESGLDVAGDEIRVLEGVESGSVVDTICAARRVVLPAAEKLHIVRTKWETYQTLFKVVPIQGSVSVVHRLREYGYGLVLVTGTLRDFAERAMRELGLQECISEIVSSESVQRSKPFPEPYLKALSLLQLPATRVIAVENA